MPKQTKKASKKKAPVKVSKVTKSNENLATLIAVTAIELALVYGFASWAIDSGSLWLYLLTFISLYLCINSLIKLFKQLLMPSK